MNGESTIINIVIPAIKTSINYIYNLFTNVRVAYKRTNLGSTYFEKTYTNRTIIAKANNTWLVK